MTDCPAVGEIQRFAQGGLSSAAQESLENHLDDCGLCRELVAEAATEEAVASAAPAWSTLAPGTKLGRYSVLGHIGSGGMGVVYAAYDPELDRRVALKLIRWENVADGELDEARGRLQREARSMARIDHAHVVKVHEVGRVEDEIFLAMEFVEGRTLRVALKEGSLGLEETLAVFQKAASGLAAAHAAGVIHRDFKPDNVLLGEAAAVKVTDFGLARGASAPPVETDSLVPSTTAPGDSASTQTGAWMGTPAYLAPEVLESGQASEASDQFSFCVALYEAIYGERPFDGSTFAGRRASLGEPVSWPKAPTLPRHVRDALQRGLSAQPAQRLSSMAELARALGSNSERRSRGPVVGALAVALLFVAGGTLYVRQRLACTRLDGPVRAAWGLDRQRAVDAALRTTLGTAAEDALSRVHSALDHYAAEWRRAAVDACEATRFRREQSDDLLDRRMACLDERAWALDSLTRELASSDGQSVANAAQAASALPAVQPCGDLASLLRGRPLPVDLQRRAELERQGRRLEDARSRYTVNDYQGMLAALTKLESPIEALGDSALTGEYWVSVAKANNSLSRSTAEVEAAQHAVEASEAAGAEPTRELAIAFLASGLTSLSRTADAHTWLRIGDALVARNPQDLDGHLQLLRSKASLAQIENRGAESLAATQERLALAERQAPDARRRVKLLLELVRAQVNALRNEDARRTLNEVKRLEAATLGPEESDVGMTLWTEAILLQEEGKPELALQRMLAAKPIIYRTFGPNSAAASRLANVTGNLLFVLRRVEEGLAEQQRAYEILLATDGSQSPHFGEVCGAVASMLSVTQKFDAAKEQAERCLAAARHGLPDQELTALIIAGEAAADDKKLPLAEQHLREALDKTGTGPATTGPDRYQVLSPLAGVLRRQGKYAEADQHYREAVERMTTVKGLYLTPDALARIHFELALTQVGLRRPRSTSLVLAKQALEEYQAQGTRYADEISHVKKLLRALQGPGDSKIDARVE